VTVDLRTIAALPYQIRGGATTGHIDMKIDKREHATQARYAGMTLSTAVLVILLTSYDMTNKPVLIRNPMNAKRNSEDGVLFTYRL
jgi:hypothetical protein